VAARSLGVYPPGIPWAIPGERISREAIQGLLEAQSHGATLFGLDAEGGCSVITNILE
jgi:arginine/lysine/ornithine decarboxylase